MKVVGQVTVNTGANSRIDLGDDSYKYRFRVAGVHADGTKAGFRGKLSTTDPDNAAATDEVLCAAGREVVRPTREDATTRYLQVLGLSDGTIITASRLNPGEEVC